jgi:signal transduction histidine kinase
MERAESLSFQLEARVFEQAVLESRAATRGAPDDTGRQRAAALRREIAGALAELTSLLSDDRNAAATATAAADWQAALDTKLALLAAGDLVAAKRVDRAQVDLRFEQLADRLRTTEDGLRLLTDAQTALGDEVQAPRRIMATLRPPVLEERGLVSALCDYVEVVRQQAGINCTLSAKLPERLPEDQEIVLYRVAQEALTNVARHSRAASARVELIETADKVVLEVHDDGVGFDPDPALKSEAEAASAYAYLVKGCSGGLVLDTIEQAFQAGTPVEDPGSRGSGGRRWRRATVPGGTNASARHAAPDPRPPF